MSSHPLAARRIAHPPISCAQRRCVARLPFSGARPRPHLCAPPLRTASLATETATQVQTAPQQANSTAPSSQPSASDTFPWTSHWYPVGTVEDLDPSRPHGAHLLGMPLALWRNTKGQWQAVEDKCSHRLAPLSEGRVESDGTLQCAYHGWQFDGRGACTHIPQLRGDDKAQQVACASRRSCVRAFPTHVAHGLLWVLPDSSDKGWEKAAVKPTMQQLIGSDILPSGEEPDVSWFVRDMPMRFDTLVENLADPSHVPFAHHGVQGKRSSEQGTKLTLQELKPEGFSSRFNMTGMDSVVSFHAPSTVRYTSGSGVPYLILSSVPTRPGWSRLYHGVLQNSGFKATSLFFRVMRFIRGIPWADHVLLRHSVLDGDTYMLHVQERVLLERGNDWRGGYYMPAPADGAVVATRRWFDEFGGAVPTCEPGNPMPPQLTKREALDRYSQHTANCKHCSKALRNVELATGVAAAAGVLAVLWLVARVVVGLPLLVPASGLGLLAAVVCAGTVAALRSLREQFIFVDYVHQDKK